MNKKMFSILLLLVMLLMVGCSNSETDLEGPPLPSGNVPPSKIDLSFTSHGEGEFKLKATMHRKRL